MFLAFVAVLGGLFGIAHSYLNSHDFQARLIEEVSRKLGCDVRVGRMKIRLHRGLDWVDIEASSPLVRPETFMKAERLRLRYDFFQALFLGKVVLTEVRISRPRITLDLSETAEAASPWPPPPPSAPSEPAAPRLPVAEAHPEKAAGASEAPSPAPPPSASPSPPISAAPWPPPPHVNLKSLMIEDGACDIVLVPAEKIECGGLQVRAGFSEDPEATGAGVINAATLQLPKNLLLRSVRGQFLWRAESVAVPSLTAQLCGGNAEATLRLEKPRGVPVFDLTVVFKDLSLSELARAAGARDLPLVGKLQAQARFQGALASVATPNGLGQVKVRDARLFRAPGLSQLGGLLNRQDFYDLPLTACETDFTLQANRLELSRIQVTAAELDLTGDGWLDFATHTEELRLKLGLAPSLAGALPAGMLDGLPRRASGWVEIPFKVWGPMDRPQNDLVARFAAIQMRAIGGTIFDRIFRSMPKNGAP
ncbi:MAG: hypothetical protein IT578_07780 [Verrucomicrobiae bacterium]|nr:hypothetical protein [Verrucomicrobiae bacterium]